MTAHEIQKLEEQLSALTLQRAEGRSAVEAFAYVSAKLQSLKLFNRVRLDYLEERVGEDLLKWDQQAAMEAAEAHMKRRRESSKRYPGGVRPDQA